MQEGCIPRGAGGRVPTTGCREGVYTTGCREGVYTTGCRREGYPPWCRREVTHHGAGWVWHLYTTRVYIPLYTLGTLPHMVYSRSDVSTGCGAGQQCPGLSPEINNGYKAQERLFLPKGVRGRGRLCAELLRSPGENNREDWIEHG